MIGPGSDKNKFEFGIWDANDLHYRSFAVCSVDSWLFTYCTPPNLEGHLAADDDQGADFPGVAEVEDVDDAKQDLEEDGRGGGYEIHGLPAKIVDVLGYQ